MCRLGIAAYWFAWAAPTALYADGPITRPVSTKGMFGLTSGRNRGGARGYTMWITSATPVDIMITFRTRAQWSRWKIMTQSRNAMAAGKCTVM